MPIVVLIIKHCFIVQNVFKCACMVSFVVCFAAGFNGNLYCFITIFSSFIFVYPLGHSSSEVYQCQVHGFTHFKRIYQIRILSIESGTQESGGTFSEGQLVAASYP